MAYEAFHHACGDWVSEALQRVSRRPIRMRQATEVTLQGEGFVSSAGILKPDFSLTISEVLQELGDLPCFDTLFGVVTNAPQLASVLLVDAGGNPIEDGNSQRWWLLSHSMYRFLAEYVRSADDLTFDVSKFERVYRLLLNYILHDQMPSLWLFSIRNLELEGAAIELESNVRIRPVLPEERIKSIQEQFEWGHMMAFELPPKVYLEYRTTIGRMAIVDVRDVEPIAQRVMFALRLIQANPVGISGHRWSTDGQPFPLMTSFIGSSDIPRSAYGGQPYLLTQKDGADLQVLWPKARRKMSDPALSIAFTRLDDSYLRNKPEDKLIDYWTALESLFLPKGANISQQGKMVASIIAHYIGRSADERKAIINTVEESHGLRNAIIHADNVKQGRLDEMVKKTSELLRRALRQRIEE